MRTVSFAIALCTATAAHAATLRPFSQIAGATVHLADLFDDLGATPDRALGRAPGPGERITVQAPQLAAIARDFSVAWRPLSGEEHAIVERRADTLSPQAVTQTLTRALEEAGAPPGADIAMPAFEPVLLPVGTHAAPEISQLSYDPAGGRFTALLSVAVDDAPAIQMRLSGQAIPTVEAAVPAHPLATGSIIAAADIRTARIRTALLHGRPEITAAAAIGMTLRHQVATGQPLTTADLARQTLVARGALVRMSLQSAGIDLTAQGLALAQGALGDRIQVQNPTSHAIMDAEITGAGEVRVQPRAATINLAAAQ